MKYPVHEMFATFQGEGVNMGLPAFFVRLYGCPVHCSFCDSAGTWHKDWVPAWIQKLDEIEIVEQIHAASMDKVVVTGGEPAIHDLVPLAYACFLYGITTCLETSGAFDIRGKFDWVTVSPKRAKLPEPGPVRIADEFKFIIEAPEDIGYYWRIVDLYRPRTDECPGGCWLPPIWLHPEWSHREDPIVLNAISEAVKRGGGRFRAGWQIHKCYCVDALDNRSRPLVPLGGDLTKGM